MSQFSFLTQSFQSAFIFSSIPGASGCGIIPVPTTLRFSVPRMPWVTSLLRSRSRARARMSERYGASVSSGDAFLGGIQSPYRSSLPAS
jgi:hypothetical protein